MKARLITTCVKTDIHIDSVKKENNVGSDR